MNPLLHYVDGIQLYVPDLQKGIEYYCNCLGLKIIWRTDTAVGLGMKEGITELVIQNEREYQEIDFKVESVEHAIHEIKKAGGQIVLL